MSKIRVIIADDHKIVYEGLSMILKNDPNIEVVGTALDGQSALFLLKNKSPIDVAILDIHMPNMDGIEVTKIIKRKYPETKVIILSVDNSPFFIKEIMKMGASGYILKNKGGEDIKNAIYTVIRGLRYFGRDIERILIDDMLSKPEKEKAILTSREVEILALIAKGLTSNEISHKLFIQESTVSTHRRNIKSKLGLKTISDITRYAIEHNIINR